MSEARKANAVLSMNTLAFTACFAVWMMNGVLVTFLADNRIFLFDKVQIGWLMGIPVLTGSLVRLPVGLLTDRYGGRIVFPAVMLVSAAACLGLAHAQTFAGFALGSLGFGLAGTGFATGIAYTSVWFPKEKQGTALGIFGVGNAGSALTSIGAPFVLRWLTQAGANPEGWRNLPRLYAALLLGMTVVFILFTTNKRPAGGKVRTLSEQLSPLRSMRVWRFGLYYFLVFGGFVALAQWLIPYYVSAYGSSLALAGILASIFSLPSGVIRALGGWMSDKLGARTTIYWVLGACALSCALLVAPRMDITSPGEGVMSTVAGTVTRVSPTEVAVGEKSFPLRSDRREQIEEGQLVLPRAEFWQEPVVQVGQVVKKKELLARGVTHIFFQANVWIFTALVFVLGIAMGIGKAAVYKYIPDYFPNDVGAVGGLVGVIGGLGGFVCPIIFGYLLRGTGLWTSCWIFLFLLSMACLVWLHLVVRKVMREQAPRLAQQLDEQAFRSLAPVRFPEQAAKGVAS
ncbi:MAG: NarK/NasA family nitrate transporter [Myxococcales bacterium]|nr:NarK/NasA family nitrate transporter [Myxococcales bacterium]